MIKSIHKDKRKFLKYLWYMSTNFIGWKHDNIAILENLNDNDEFNINNYWTGIKSINIGQFNTPLSYIISNRKSKLLGEHNCIFSYKQLEKILGTSINYRNEDRYAKNSIYKLRSYPSGGALYPIEIFIKIWKVDGIENGYYYYDINNRKLDLLKRDITFEDVLNSSPITIYNMDTKSTLNDKSCVQIIFVANYKNIFNKYGNLAYKLANIEIGHMAQNIILSSVEENINNLPVAGIFTDNLKSDFNLSNEDWIVPEYAVYLG